MSNILKAIFLIIIAGGALAGMGMRGNAAVQTIDERRKEAERQLDKFFVAMGGREQFANAYGEYIAIQVNDPRVSKLPFYFELCWSYRDARQATRANALAFTRRTGFDGKSSGWTLKQEQGKDIEFAPWSEKRVKTALADWRGNFEGLTHRLAKRDPDVKAVMGVGPWEGWLEIFEKGDTVFYLRLNDDGAPIRFRRVYDGTAVTFGPLVDQASARFPSHGLFEDSFSSFDFHIFKLMTKPMADKTFAPPADKQTLALNCQ